MFQLISTIIAVVLIAVDQMVKNWAAEVLTKGEIAIIEDVFYFKYTENTGVAFSMFSDNRWILVGLTSVMLIAVLAFFLSGKVTDKLQQFSLALILSGGVGNLIDRISLGYVIDYIDVRIINFAIFNIADICICVGAFLMCVAVYLEDKKEKQAKNEKKAEFDEIDKDLEAIFGREKEHE
ncbi:MAG: signal peptidase II [Oscillospiraceae bacterium]|nr:signal peptidase II [Oscillospiraceae bacterium]MBR3610300.1 signal peptidase II [Oscillospiraceae bacterium]